MFGDVLGLEMISQFGCPVPNGTDCSEQIARFTVATQWICSTRYALERSYGPDNPNGILYPVEFAYESCLPNHACHGTARQWVTGRNYNKNKFGRSY